MSGGKGGDRPADRRPVTDWRTDWDHLDARWRDDPFPIWDALRDGPIARTERFEGAWLPTRYEDVEAIARDTGNFTSRRVVLRDRKFDDPPLPAPPLTSDPPEHKAHKQVLLPLFSPREVARLEPLTRRICNALIDGFVADGGCDAAQQYARHVPVRIIAYMLGVPIRDSHLFIRWIHEILEVGASDDERNRNATKAMRDYFRHHIALRKEGRTEADPDGPEPDLIRVMMDGSLNGVPLEEKHVLGTLNLLMVAGIDTTWSAIGASLLHLGRHPDDRRRLIEEPGLMPTAVEELLRAYAPVTMAREVRQDVELVGCPMKKGEMVLLSFPAANRDPAMFPDADKVVLDRQENRHAAFGIGIHRCVGSNLARMELRVAIEEWLGRIPDYRVAGEIRWSDGSVRGPRTLPVTFG
ncbi:MAG: cytochrome P450 [Defluviicoccus sp.]|nr:cytochrome P450 [Defluviicoccus sp.]